MNIPTKDVVSAHLMDDLYKRLNLVGRPFSEFYFKEMLEIAKIPRMDEWPKTLETSSNKFLFSMVSFFPQTYQDLPK